MSLVQALVKIKAFLAIIMCMFLSRENHLTLLTPFSQGHSVCRCCVGVLHLTKWSLFCAQNSLK